MVKFGQNLFLYYYALTDLRFVMIIHSILFYKITFTELPYETVHILVADTFLAELIKREHKNR